MLSMPSGWGSTIGAISSIMTEYFRGIPSSHSIIIVSKRGRSHRASTCSEPCMVLSPQHVRIMGPLMLNL